MNAAYVTLAVAGETYAVAAAAVSEVVKLQPLTRIPAMPRCVRGLMNLRGTVIPVVDLAQQLGVGETEITDRTCVAVVDTPEAGGVRSLMGVISHEVQDVVLVDESAIEAAPAFGSRVPPGYLAGLARVGEKAVLVLDLARILSADEILAVHEAARA
ncbi:MAG TPA: chemotaxis protein CheW [Thermoanaerobaculia bacterium]